MDKKLNSFTDYAKPFMTLALSVNYTSISSVLDL